MIMTVTFVKENEDEDSIHYVERTGRATTSPGHIELARESFPDHAPGTIQVTFEWVEETYPSPTAVAGAVYERGSIFEAAARPSLLRTGDRVKVVKMRDPGVQRPPEWLEQYVGRTGTVQRVTAHGAVIKLDQDTTWFSFGELETGD